MEKEVSSESIRLTFTQKGRKVGALATLLTISGGMGAFVNGAIKEYKSKTVTSTSSLNEKKIIMINGQLNENTHNINRIHRKLDVIEDDQKEILKILIEKLR